MVVDPLSIAAAATSITFGCLKAASVLYEFINATHNIESNISGLRDEALGLSRSTEAIQKAWTTNHKVAAACATEDADLWLAIKASLSDCQATIARLNSKLDEINKKGVRDVVFWKKPVKTVKLKMKETDVDMFRKQIQSHNCAMQSSLLTIQICLQLDGKASQEDIQINLKNMQACLAEIKNAIAIGGVHASRGIDEVASKQASQTLKDLVAATETFHSDTTSNILGGPRSTKWDGSEFGMPLTAEKRKGIEDWIKPINERQENQIFTPSISQMSSSPSIYAQVVRNLLEQAASSAIRGDYEKAGQNYKSVLRFSEQDPHLVENVSSVKTTLALMCTLQRTWDAVTRILIPGLDIDSRDQVARCDMLALIHYHLRDYQTATEYCEQALEAKSSQTADAYSTFYHSISLLAAICEAQGAQAEAQAWLSCIESDSAQEQDKSSLFEQLVFVMARGWPYSTVGKNISTIQGETASAAASQLSVTERQNVEHEVRQRDNMNDDSVHDNNSDVSSEVNYRLLTGHTRSIVSLAFSSDSKQLVSGSQDGTVRVWDATICRERFIFTHESPVFAVALSGNSEAAFSIDQSDNISMWSIKDGILKQSIPCTSKVFGMAISPDEVLIALIRRDTIDICNPSWNVLRNLDIHQKRIINTAKFSPDSRFLVSGGWDFTIKITDAISGNVTRTLSNDYTAVTEVAFSPDGNILCATKGRVACIWDLRVGTDSPQKTLGGHTREILDVAFSPVHGALGTTSMDATVRLWDLRTDTTRFSFKEESVQATGSVITFSDNGKYMATGASYYAGAGAIDAMTRLWNMSKIW